MKKKFSISFTGEQDIIEAFARAPISPDKGLGYQDTVVDMVTGEVSPNPEGIDDFIARKAKEHNMPFVTGWAKFLVQTNLDGAIQQTVDTVKPQLDNAILKPVEDAIQVTYE